MPQVKEVKSLFKLSAIYVAKNIHYWCNPVEEVSYTVVEPECRPKYIYNSFDNLPLVILEEVIKVLKKIGAKNLQAISAAPYQKDFVENGIYVFFDYSFSNTSYRRVQVKEDIFKNLITQQLQELDLSQIRCPLEISNLLDIASYKCSTKLLNLNLQHTNSFNCGIFFVKFENLQILNISHSVAEDIWLQIIGSSCKHLRELDVSFCRRVTDNGIQGLCVSYFDNQDRKNELVGLCKSIEKLNLTRTKVTNKGVQMALKYLPSLKSIIHFSLIQVLADVAQATLNDKALNIPTYSLSGFSVSHDDLYRSGSFGSILNLCPFIVKIDLELLFGFSNYDLLSFRFLKRLRELKVHDMFYVEPDEENQGEISHITFSGGLCPLLKEIGISLKILSLSGLVSLNVKLIAELCPNLCSLNLDTNRFYTTASEDEIISSNPKRSKIESPILRQLVELRLNSSLYNNDFHFLHENLMLLLSSSSLTSVTIGSCNLFTDEFLADVAKRFYFQNLKKLELCCCPMITECGLRVFLQDANVLEKIVVNRCERIGPEIVENLKTLALQKNWKLSVFRLQ